jgi:hypothetical protein
VWSLGRSGSTPNLNYPVASSLRLKKFDSLWLWAVSALVLHLFAPYAVAAPNRRGRVIEVRNSELKIPHVAIQPKLEDFLTMRPDERVAGKMTFPA